MGIKVDIQAVFRHAAALIFHSIDDTVDTEFRSQRELIQVSRDGVVFFGDCAGIGVYIVAAALFTVAVCRNLKYSIRVTGDKSFLRICFHL